MTDAVRLAVRLSPTERRSGTQRGPRAAPSRGVSISRDGELVFWSLHDDSSPSLMRRVDP
jgi:hypothetical protein